MPKKKFIDKKNAVTFRLVNRSQQDPLYVDESAPQNVLLPVRIPEKYANLAGGIKRQSTSGVKIDPTKRKTEQAKFGIYYDDDYNYLQHLREPGRNEVFWEPIDTKATKEQPGAKNVSIKLPSSVFASEYEEKEGIMKKAANARPGPRPDWDPDVVAALDEDFDFDNPDNELEDNFMDLAMQEGGTDGYLEAVDEDEDEYDSEGPMDGDYFDEEQDRLGPLGDTFGREETKSRFTEYSMSSSVIRRNEQLTLLDDRFEKFYEQYDDPEVGALDCEEIEGHVEVNDDVLLQYAEAYQRENDDQFDLAKEKEWIKERVLKFQEEDDDEEELVEMPVEDDAEKKWDCESILSTYSNIYNHPKLIDEPKRCRKIEINSKTGLPAHVLGSDGDKLTIKSLAKLEQGGSNSKQDGPKSLCDQSVISTLSVLSIRPKDESPEEKRERKKLLKEYRTERRIERKANTLAFKQEKKIQEKNKINNQVNTGQRIV
ncbi:protein LTV1 homolog [Anopheles bellator]|uniref:protein LTV1 homolog n=1 Tax=Anopheles bellator TaxID=139047 RepID=UPI002649CD10|nr:protein LTV1 homolog [Anopheles bellator]